jgi:signal transduction histidine kinase
VDARIGGRRLLDGLPNDLPDGLVVAGPDARILVFNRAAERITGLAALDAVGADIREALPLQDTTGRRWWACTDPWSGLAIRTGHRERLLVLPGGREVLVTARYVRSGRSAAVDRVVLQIRDTEARRRAEHDHAGLISTVAHELRSPLTSVKGFTSTLLRRWDRLTDEQKRLMLSTVEADADRVTRLITELLDISRLETGRLVLRRQLIDLDVVARSVVDKVSMAYPELDAELLFEENLPRVYADPDKVEQVLTNLVENAAKYASPVGMRVTGAVDGTDVVVAVHDRGPGIAGNLLEHLFEKFFRAPDTKPTGSGLGLWISRGLVEAHGGRLDAISTAGEGSTFRFTLPLAAFEELHP